MAGLSDIVNAQISLQTKGITRQGFGRLLLLTYHTVFPELSKLYGDLEELGEDFPTTSPTYRMALKAFSGDIKPADILVGRRTRVFTQIIDLTPNNITVGFPVRVTVIDSAGEETDIEYVVESGDALADIATALQALIDPIAGVTATIVTSTTVRCTMVAGTMFYFEELNGLTFKDSTANPGSGGAGADFTDIVADNPDFYGVALDSQSEAQVTSLAAAVEATERIAGFNFRDDDVGTSSTTDVGSDLLLAQYARSFSVWSGHHAGYAACRMFGEAFPQDAGSVNWAYMTLSGVTADVLKAAFEANLKNKNVSYYQFIAGKGVTFPGLMAVGQNTYIDLIHGRDWLVQRLREAGFDAVSTRPKLEYEDSGAAVIENKLNAVLLEGVRKKVLAADPAPQLIMPKVLEVDPAERARRHLPGIRFKARVSGAINTMDITGELVP